MRYRYVFAWTHRWMESNLTLNNTCLICIKRLKIDRQSDWDGTNDVYSNWPSSNDNHQGYLRWRQLGRQLPGDSNSSVSRIEKQKTKKKVEDADRVSKGACLVRKRMHSLYKNSALVVTRRRESGRLLVRFGLLLWPSFKNKRTSMISETPCHSHQPA